MANAEPMILEDADTPPVAPLPGKDADGVPYCSKHHCRMKAASSGKKGSRLAYYSCQVEGCTETDKRIKTQKEGVVPSTPQECPRCSRPKASVYCERDMVASTAASVILRCPACGWKSNALAVPQLAAALIARHERRQESNEPPAEKIGER